MSWEYESTPEDSVLLDKVLQKSPSQEKPIVPAIAQLLQKGEPEEDLHLYITPTMEGNSPEVSLGNESSLEVPSIHLPYTSGTSTECESPTWQGLSPQNMSESNEFTDPFQSLAQPFFTAEPQSEEEADRNTLEKLLDSLDEENLTQRKEEDGTISEADSMGSYLDSEGYFKEPARKICRYKRGRRSIVLGNTSAPKRQSVPQKRQSDVDIASLLDADIQSFPWNSSMESTPPPRTASPDLFDSD